MKYESYEVELTMNFELSKLIGVTIVLLACSVKLEYINLFISVMLLLSE